MTYWMTDSDGVKAADYVPGSPGGGSGPGLITADVSDRLRQRAKDLMSSPVISRNVRGRLAPGSFASAQNTAEIENSRLDTSTFAPRAFDTPEGIYSDWRPKSAKLSDTIRKHLPGKSERRALIARAALNLLMDPVTFQQKFLEPRGDEKQLVPIYRGGDRSMGNKSAAKTPGEYIGVDLDGTLAEYHGWKGEDNIGKPIPKMVSRVKRWLSGGKRVKIFTARAHNMSPVGKRAIQAWCRKYLGRQLPITNEKDPKMVKLWDDRAISISPNTGIRKSAGDNPAAKINWKDYAGASQNYLSRPVFKGTPLTGKMLSTAASNTMARTGTYVPPQLALAQAQFESSMGTRGKSKTTNPYNVGEYDSGTKLRFDNTTKGVQAYYDLIARDYLSGGKTVPELLEGFVNSAGKRYASNPEYESNIKAQLPTINKHLSQYHKNRRPSTEPTETPASDAPTVAKL